MALTLEELKEQYPKIYGAIYNRGHQEGLAEGKAFPQEVSEEIEALTAEEKTKSPIEKRIKEMWDGDHELQEEFRGNFETWAAYCKAESEGRFRIVGTRRVKT